MSLAGPPYDRRLRLALAEGGDARTVQFDTPSSHSLGLRHRLGSIASRQNASAIAQHDQAARILGHPAAIDGSSNGQVVVPIDDFLLAGALAALLEQFDGVFAFGFQRNTPYLLSRGRGFRFGLGGLT